MPGVTLGLALRATWRRPTRRCRAGGRIFFCSCLGPGATAASAIGRLGFRSDELLGLQDEAATPIEIEASVGGEPPGAGGNLHRELEGVAAGVVIAGSSRTFSRSASSVKKKLGIGALGSFPALPPIINERVRSRCANGHVGFGQYSLY